MKATVLKIIDKLFHIQKLKDKYSSVRFVDDGITFSRCGQRGYASVLEMEKYDVL